ncbi:MAG: hypothetical protein KC454_06650 [Flavobacteriales bacterium]|nr:hypothetical protein [Flavobacteriales bacterium]
MKILLSLLLMNSLSVNAQRELTWSIFHPVQKVWIDLGAKGSVQEALVQSGELPDPFYGKNEDMFGWIEEHQWEFKSIFFVSKEMLMSNFVEIEFPSIDTYASIYVNNKLVFKANNAFRPYSSQIKKLLKEGSNEISVIFTSPVMFHKEKYLSSDYILPAPNDVHKIAVAPYSRKPQYQFGWDWSLRMNTIGFNKVVKIHSYSQARIINRTTRIVSVNDEEAVIEYDLYLSNKEIKKIEWHSSLFGTKLISAKKGKFTRKEVLLNPKLWWPKGQGDAYMYSDSFDIKTIDKQEIESFEVKFGVKTSELIQETDEWGTSYYFKVNNRRVFCKGADYIPQDIFPARVKDKDVSSIVETMAESNFNMVRVWGGGYYPDEVFFDKCDELGIMVWQDLMFACAMYPGDEQFICNVKGEFDYQIPRISKHPSVVLFNGNNEVEVAWENWGFQIKHNLYGRKAKEIENSYDLLFKKVAPNKVKEHSTIPYIHTSPLSNWGNDKFYDHGSQHYWGVWHGKDPIEYFGKKIGRFNAEYGFQSFPEYQTIHSFSEEKEWDLDSDVMKHHQKSYVGNKMILKHAKRLYGEPKSFKEFVYFSQLTQAKAVSMAISGHRADSPRCGGTLYWQMNDCWPAPTWSSIDYFGNWKALQYAVQKDYEDIAVVEVYHDLNDIEYFLVTDSPETLIDTLKYRIFDLTGAILSESKVVFSASAENPAKIILNLGDNELLESNDVVIEFNIDNGYSRSFDRVSKNTIKAEIPSVLFSLNPLKEDGKKSTLEIKNTEFVRSLWVTSTNSIIKIEKNFISLLPGQHSITIKHDGELSIDDLEFMWH